MEAKVFQLDCAVQTYAWGKLGNSSAVAQLSQNGNKEFKLDDKTPYAELWMGTHPKGPSKISGSGKLLFDWMSSHPDAKGNSVTKTFPGAGELPFLFKVLSVNKSLSIQAHPNKSHAEELHKEKPDKYPDSNHKPEMAIALTPFEGMCGFRPKEEIVQFLKDIPEFSAVIDASASNDLIGSSDEKACQDSLKKCFSSLMNADTNLLKEQLLKLEQRIKKAGNPSGPEALFLRLHEQFPGDGGCFCLFFLNHMTLNPGEAMFLEANLPHAYLSGDCIECMACSDNVVRAGLTPKFKDVPTLCQMLIYKCKPAKENLFPSTPSEVDKYATLYKPPVKDFAVTRIQLPKDVKNYTVASLDSASILLVIEGEAKGQGESLNLKRGSVIFVSANSPLDLCVTSPGMDMYRAFCEM